MQYLPRDIRIDWLRFQVSSHVDMVRTITKLLGLPFEKYSQAHLHDIRETNVLALNKVWHRVYEFQNSLIGVREPDSGPCTDRIYHHFVDLNGATLAAVDFNRLIALLAQYGSVKGYAVLKTINTGGFIMIPVPLCLTCLDRNFETGFLTTLGLFL